jgi:hypothetical protein
MQYYLSHSLETLAQMNLILMLEKYVEVVRKRNSKKKIDLISLKKRIKMTFLGRSKTTKIVSVVNIVCMRLPSNSLVSMGAVHPRRLPPSNMILTLAMLSLHLRMPIPYLNCNHLFNRVASCLPSAKKMIPCRSSTTIYRFFNF